MEIIVGIIIGSVMMKKIFSGVVLRFIVVFLMEWFSLCRCEEIIIVM